MIYGIIDVGSNTIGLTIYKYEKGTVSLLLNKKTMAGLAEYVKNGELSNAGIKKVCSVLNTYKEIVENFKIDNVFVFATASLRNISNTDEAVLRIKEETGFNTDIVLGENEAIYDFIGASQVVDVSGKGILIDIGGGSTELVMYNNKKIVKAYSIPIGSLSMYSKYVSNLIPTEDEKLAIKGEVLYHLKKIEGIGETSVACGVGGTIRATGKLCENIFKKDTDKTLIKSENIKKIIKKCDEWEKGLTKKILKTVPDRIHTIIPGMIILNTIVKFCEVKEIYVSSYGVREGYLFSKVLGEKEGKIGY